MFRRQALRLAGRGIGPVRRYGDGPLDWGFCVATGSATQRRWPLPAFTTTRDLAAARRNQLIAGRAYTLLTGRPPPHVEGVKGDRVKWLLAMYRAAPPEENAA